MPPPNLSRVTPLIPAAGANLARTRLSLHPPAMALCIQQKRNASFSGKPDPEDMGGPAGQESFPASSGKRRRIEKITLYGVLGACSIMLIAKLAQRNSDPNANYVLVHDSTKGELDDVKYIKAPEVPKP
ncbi:hypothetical protein N656DRAFT_801270 [Canariomyces notabilis]|uniref:Uncharacterized protein n=1 Tax=Canariomyces notabilis TaxID=2074819 RepID=A0AAN6QJ51_9PEZI|nr:hypothetical protein N656DRAFT_801270 [Canariomyces arenarius]